MVVQEFLVAKRRWPKACRQGVNNYLEDGLHGSKMSTLFAGDTGNEEIDLDLVKAVHNPGTWKVPLDQGSFDERQSKLSIAVVMLAICRKMEHFRDNRAGCDTCRRGTRGTPLCASHVLCSHFALHRWMSATPAPATVPVAGGAFVYAGLACCFCASFLTSRRVFASSSI